MATSALDRESAPQVAVPRIDALVGAFVDRNPSLPRRAVERAGRVVAALGSVAMDLTEEQQRALLAGKDKLGEIFVEVLERLEIGASDPDEGVGEGVRSELSLAEGRRRLASFAKPTKLEDWAGEVAGPVELERTLGIKRSTLHDWHAQHRAVIALLAGVRKHVFPVAQFVDGRPVTGLREVVDAAGDERTAWAWLIEPHPSLGGKPPLDLLKAGKRLEVADLASRDFGQP